MTLVIEDTPIQALDEVAALAAQTFAELHEGIETPQRIAAYVARHLNPAAFRQVAQQPGWLTLRLVENGTLVGYAQAGPSPVPEAISARPAVELKRLYLARSLYGRGLAARLMDAVIDWARAQAYRSLWLDVGDFNQRAIGFYKKCGFVQRGTVLFDFEGEQQTDILMSYGLSDRQT